MELLVMGIEASAFRVDVLVSDLEGRVAGRGCSGWASTTSTPTADVAMHLGEALDRALAGLDPHWVRAVVVGAAGILGFRRGRSANRLAGVWKEAGLTACPITILPDAVTAFSAGSSRRSGSVLIAGVGAIAARVCGDQVVTRIDGNGWLIGDDGSGFWLGRQAVRAVFAALDGRAEDTLLRASILTVLCDGGPIPENVDQQTILLRDAVYDGPPIALAALAPLVPAAAEAGDRIAHRIVERAVELLVDTVDGLGCDEEPLVLAGSLLTDDGPIRREVRRRLALNRGLEPVVAKPGAGGALWIAARSIDRGFGSSARRLFTELE